MRPRPYAVAIICAAVCLWGTVGLAQLPLPESRPEAETAQTQTPANGEATDAASATAESPHAAQPAATQPEDTVLADRLSERIMRSTVDRLSGRIGAQARREIMGIALWRHLYCLVLLLLTFIASHVSSAILKHHAMRLAKRTDSQLDDLIFEAAIVPTRLVIQSLGIYLAVMVLLTGMELPEGVVRWFGRICLAVAAAAVFRYVYHLVDVADYAMRQYARRTDNDLDDTFVDVVRKTLRLFVVAIGVLFIGRYILDWDVTALLASAGIAGVAIAFAAQDTIANLFGTVMLLLDRPFRVGERVIVEGADGPVEAIGFRSTRIRTLDGNQVSVPNKTVANSRIENVGRRPHIKRVATIGVTYDTPYVKMQQAVEIIREVLADHEGMDPDFPPRVHFSGFGAYSLDILLIAWYHPGDYWGYMAWCERVNFAIMQRFNQEGIEFAFPTSTTYLAGDPKRPLAVGSRTLPIQTTTEIHENQH